MQLFLEQCCWGRARRWADSTEQRGKELRALLILLFKPQLQAEGLTRVENGSSEGIFIAIAGYQAKELHLTLPGVARLGNA
ncbi:MAG TPA: hypothetical protein VL178_15320 [Pseudomonas sp.]|nr:hypothetical protein [Pseudomonas sp.]